jgi:protein TonB
MFENSLVALDSKKQGSKRWLSFPLAVGLHLLVLVSLGFAQYWNVEKVPEPEVNIDPIHLELAPPPMARGERDARPAVKPAPAAAPAPVAPHTPVQPAPVVPDQPIPNAAPPSNEEIVPSSTGNDSSGPTQGDPNGVPGGDPNGEINGKGPIGSLSHGTEIVNDAPILVTGAVIRPVLVDRIEPQYTETARRVRLEGTVIVQAVIDEAGRVVDVKILKPLPMGLDKAAVDAVSRWRFKPATLYGRPVKVYYSLTVNFRVQ